MKTLTKNYYLKVFLLVIFLLLLTKIDFRVTSYSNSSSVDDASYMYHAYTIGHDFDLDYTNQIQITDEYTKLGFYFNGTQYVPKHPIGPGIFAAPFAFAGKLLQMLNTTTNFSENNIAFFIYSLSSIFYFFTSILLISKVINNSPKFNKTTPISIFYLLLGSGLAYYSFERFSMTHTYEVFSIAVLFYVAYKNPNGDKAKINAIIGFLPAVFLLIRWVNIFIFLIPFLYYFLIDQKKSIRNILQSKLYYIGLTLGGLLFLTHTKILYNVYTLNPKLIYRDNAPIGFLEYTNLDSYFSFDFITLTIKSLAIIIFSTEFGLLFFSPVLFFMFFSLFKLLYKKEFSLITILFPIIGIPFAIVILWQASGSSYGYRYLTVLIPVSIFLAYRYLDRKIIKYLYGLNAISIYLFIKFETNELTSLNEGINLFGRFHEYSGRYYLQGVLDGALSINTYLVWIMTSFFAVLCFKLLILVFSYSFVEEQIINFGYMNGDVEKFLQFTEKTSFVEILILIILFTFFSTRLLKRNK